MSGRHTKDFDFNVLKGDRAQAHYLGGTTKLNKTPFQEYLEKETEKVTHTNQDVIRKQEQQLLQDRLNHKQTMCELPEEELNELIKKEPSKTEPFIRGIGFEKKDKKEDKKPKKSSQTEKKKVNISGVVSKKLKFKK